MLGLLLAILNQPAKLPLNPIVFVAMLLLIIPEFHVLLSIARTRAGLQAKARYHGIA